MVQFISEMRFPAVTNQITPRAGTSHEPRSGEQAQPRASDSSRRQRDENQMLDYPTPKAAGGGKKCLLLHSSAPRVDYTGTIAQENKAELSPLIYFKTSDRNHRVQKLG